MQIKFSKLKPVPFSIAQSAMHSADCLANKSRNFKRGNILNFKKKGLTENSFRQQWFCTNCLQVFAIKPLKKYKTLQKFNLCCPCCNSKDVFHNSSLTKAILAKESTCTLLLLCKKNGQEIEWAMKDNTKYIPLFSNS